MVAVGVVETRVDTAGRRRFTLDEKREIVEAYHSAADSCGRGAVR